MLMKVEMQVLFGQPGMLIKANRQLILASCIIPCFQTKFIQEIV